MPKENPAPKEEIGQNNLDFRSVYHVFLEKAWILVTCLIVAVFWAVGYLQRAPVLFSATATLQVEQDDEKVCAHASGRRENTRGLEILRTMEQTLQARTLLERVVETNNLAHDPRFVSQAGPPPPKERMVSLLSGFVQVRLRRGTRLIDVTVAHTNPELTARLANSIVQEFINQNYDQYTNSSTAAYNFLNDQKQQLEKKLHDSELALQSYKENTGSVSLDEKHNIDDPKLKELSQKLTETKAGIIGLETDKAQIRELGTNDIRKLMVLPLVLRDREVADAKSALDKAETDFVALKQRYLPKHSRYIAQASQVEEYRKALANAVARVPQTLDAALEAQKAAAATLERAVKDQEDVALRLERKSIQYNALQREVTSDQKLYDNVLNRLKETDITTKLNTSKVRMIQPAYVPDGPYWPNRKRIISQAVLGGLVAGIFLVLFINSLDNSLKTVDQAEQYLNMPVLSAVPQVRELKTGGSQIVVSEDAKSLAAEAFRSLRTSLSMLGREDERKIFLFTSAVPQEGKTFSTTNYSVCLAQQGLRTLLIDCDLRRPAVELTILGKKARNFGVTDYLTGRKKLGEIVQKTSIENFSFIPAGTTAPNPAELLAQGGLSNLLDEVSMNFDRIVIDSAPIHAVSDTLLILDRVQTVCVVVRAQKTPRKGVARAIKLLQNAEAPMGGIVLNRLPSRRGRRYYYDLFYYDYSYHERYGEKGVYGS